MQYPDLELPPQPATDIWLRETNRRDDVEAVVPLAVEEDGTPWVFGAIIFSEQAATMIYYDLSSWNLLTEYQLENEFNIYSDDLLHPEIGLLRRDAQVGKKLIQELAREVMDITKIGFLPYAGPNLSDEIKASRESCDCKGIFDSRVQSGPGLSTIETEKVYMCTNCSEVHGLEHEGRRVPLEKAFDANWVLEEGTADDIFDAQTGAGYFLYTNGETIGRLERSIALMSMVGGSISHSYSRYQPDKQGCIVNVQNDELTGYLTWSAELDEALSLQQLYTRENYRGRGIASSLVTNWEYNYCHDGRFYLEDLNSKSRRLFDKLGYFNQESPEAIEHFLVRGISNDWQASKDDADSLNNYVA